MSKPVSSVLDRTSAAVVPVKRDSLGVVSVANNPAHMNQIARRSAVVSARPFSRFYHNQPECVLPSRDKEIRELHGSGYLIQQELLPYTGQALQFVVAFTFL